MNDILKYKGYEGTVEVDMAIGVCRGRILFVKDLVTYEAESPKNLQAEFESAVDDYIETCKQLGRAPQRPSNGQFSVRVEAQIHTDAIRRSIQDGVALNSVVVRALKCYLYGKSEVNNHYTVIKGDVTGDVSSHTKASAVVQAPYEQGTTNKASTNKVWH